jgi:hypothetical protein
MWFTPQQRAPWPSLSPWIRTQYLHPGNDYVFNHGVLWIVKRKNRPRTDIEEQWQMFNQARFVPVNIPTLPISVVCRIVTSLVKPECPEHVGKMVHHPFWDEFKFTNFENYDKMYSTRTWSYPVNKSIFPLDALILPIR